MTKFLLIALLLSSIFMIVAACLLHSKHRKYTVLDTFGDYDVIKEANRIIGE